MMRGLLVFAGASVLSLFWADDAHAQAKAKVDMPEMNMPGASKPAQKAPARKSVRAAPLKAAAPPPTTRTGAAPSNSTPADHSGHPPLPASTEPSPSDQDMPETDMGAVQPSQDQQHRAMPSKAMSDEGSGVRADNIPGTDMPQGSAVEMDHDMAGMPAMSRQDAGGTGLAPGNAAAPAPPDDHYADRVFGSAGMAESRALLQSEHGGTRTSFVSFNVAEYQIRDNEDGYRWDGQAWYGGDLNRLTIKSEGEGMIKGGKAFMETAEIQGLFSRAIDPYWNLQVGVRYDFKPNPSRTYATLGIEGVAPYWFETEAAIFLSNKGEMLGRIEGYYDQRITQRLILQPRVEINLSAQDVPETRIGGGISNIEFGLRLRYELKREFASYVGISFDRRLGETATFARTDGERVFVTSLAIGIRTWF